MKISEFHKGVIVGNIILATMYLVFIGDDVKFGREIQEGLTICEEAAPIDKQCIPMIILIDKDTANDI